MITIGFYAMAVVAFMAIRYGFKLTKQMNSDEFREEIYNEELKARFGKGVSDNDWKNECY
ncbi:hypothetical protein GGG87_03715 [Streptococcus sp. zg-86]|uniref:Uncharacterized protein n=1 Tax=Streptococcus zhangguiae TaxID=2664091 RepID=A0A6I4RGW7_9STRE|nr:MULTISPECIES: hypothetical protein [unclassified Streptococcus]MTB64109.1 hypothetical protein [Streptococcus sp. zg-86]MTB90565.1 hypothetical protein [Streptococcus sp. zg-36]MWV56097.1 hypothetical protein [Streptococcus sp. zg-70]QTH48274.1 hypothetical protein J5M87_02805 [Streptococcus sp. zg-86]